ncbi:MAG TPA: LPS export ABC transporter permease LptG [Rhodospirillaceae bacterium]|nr:LptF/LptG family permease [Alphaproteobacteria bacterium]HBH26047.1 LPS export ABC transporter permease LptG [Rhodospirillaceae bacterium]
MIPRPATTLWAYLFGLYARNLAVVLLGLWTLVYLFDTVELLRRARGQNDLPASLVLEMGLLKLPDVGQALIPFAVLAAAMFTLWSLSRTGEMTAMRAGGLSLWQMLAPLTAVALALGIVQIGALGPLSAALLGKYARLEAQHLKNASPAISVFAQGLWLRQETTGEGYAILHADRIGAGGREMEDVTVFLFDLQDAPRARVDAPTGRLAPGFWALDDADVHNLAATGSTAPHEEATWVLPTNLTPQDLAESFSGARSMALWALPGHIRVLEATGFDASALRVRFHTLLAVPLTLVAMVLVSAALFIRPASGRGALARAAVGVVGGLVVFFAVRFAEALGTTGQIPPALAAWSPALATFLIAFSLVLHLEEG